MTQAHGSACLRIEQPAPSPPQLRIIRGGQKREFERSLLALRPALHGRALRLTRNRIAADDLVQDTLLRALRFESSFHHGTNLHAWANQILYSVFATQCRRRARDRRAMAWLASDPCAWNHQEAAPDMLNLSPAMAAALSSLPEHYRTVLELVDIGDYAYRDAAEVLGVPVGTVMSRLFRARKILASKILEERAA